MAATKKAPPISKSLLEMGNGRHLFKPTGELDETSDETKIRFTDCCCEHASVSFREREADTVSLRLSFALLNDYTYRFRWKISSYQLSSSTSTAQSIAP